MKKYILISVLIACLFTIPAYAIPPITGGGGTGSMTYPDVGIAVSTGSAWDTSVSIDDNATAIRRTGGSATKVPSTNAANDMTYAPTREIWVAPRTDGVAGTGTIDNPYDVSTSAKLHAIFGRTGVAGSYTTAGWATEQGVVHFYPGTYHTDYEFMPMKRHKYIGAGIDKTIIIRDQNATGTVFSNYAVADDNASYITVSDMTINANATGKSFDVSCITLRGNNHLTVERVRCTGANGIDAETFAIWIANASASVSGGNNAIVDSVVDSCSGTNLSALSIANSVGGTAYDYNSRIERNKVDTSATMGATAWDSIGLTIRDNWFNGVAYGVNIDVGVNTGVVIEGNDCNSTNWGIVVGGGSTYNDFRIENNVIANASIGILLNGNVVAPILAGNVFTGAGPTAIDINGATNTGIVAKDNIVGALTDETATDAGVVYYRSSAGAVKAASVTDSGLTATRVLFSGASGLLADDSDLTFATDTLTATKFAGALNGTVGATTPAAGTFTTLGAGAGGFSVDPDGDVTGKSFSTTRSVTAEQSLELYERSEAGDGKVVITADIIADNATHTITFGNQSLNFSDGTFTNAKLCTYTTVGNIIACNTDATGTGDFLADGSVPMTGAFSSTHGAASLGVADTTDGILTLFGDDNVTGPTIVMMNSAAEDDTEEGWVFGPALDTAFYLGTIDSTGLFKFYNSGNFSATGNVAGATYGSDASVSDTELKYINTLSSNAQDQLNAKAALVSPAFTTPGIGVATGTSLALTGNLTGLMPSVVVLVSSGTSEDVASETVLTHADDSSAANAYVGMTLYNVTDGVSGVVTASTGTTITVAAGSMSWANTNVYQLGPGPSQSGSMFMVAGAGTISHPATVGYAACYMADGTNKLTVDMASDSMEFTGMVSGTVAAIGAGDCIDSSDTTVDDFMCIFNKSATAAKGMGSRGTWVDGGAS